VGNIVSVRDTEGITGHGTGRRWYHHQQLKV